MQPSDQKQPATLKNITIELMRWTIPAFGSRMLVLARSFATTYVISQQGPIEGATNTYIAPLNSILAMTTVSASYFSPLMVKQNSDLPALFQQAVIIQLSNAAVLTSITGLFVGIYRAIDNSEISSTLVSYYSIALTNLFLPLRPLMNNVLIAKNSKNAVPVFSALALGLNVGFFVLLDRYKQLSIMTIPAAGLVTDGLVLLAQVAYAQRIKKLDLFSFRSCETLKKNLWDHFKNSLNMNLQAVLEVLMGVADALLVQRLGITNQNLWNVANSFFFLVFPFGVDISRTLATLLSSYKTSKEKWICYGLCKLLGLSITGITATLLFSPLQEQIVKLFLPKKLFSAYEEHHKEMNQLLGLMLAVSALEGQRMIEAGLIRGERKTDIPWISKATVGVLYGLELPAMLVAAFCFNANLFTFLSVWLAGVLLLDAILQLRAIEVLTKKSFLSCSSFSFFQKPGKNEKTPLLNQSVHEKNMLP